MGLEIFRENITFNKPISSKLTDSLMELISKERDGEQIDRILIKNILRMLVDLSLYDQLFEKQFLLNSQQLYCMESNKKIQSLAIIEYLSYVDKRISEENDRLSAYLDFTTSKRLIQLVEKELIENHLDTILKMNFDELFEESNIKYLSLSYELLNKVADGSNKLCLQFNHYIKNKGKIIVSVSGDKDKNMVQELLDFKDKMDTIVAECFAKNEKFINSLKEAFEYFINQRTNKPAELIAKFVDTKLRSGNKESSEEEFEKILDKIMVLFRFIHGKDIFEAFYKKDLAKRLLVGKSASVDAEKSMLLKLKQECGSAFTSRLEGMFKDMELSRELVINFKQYLINAMPDYKIDMNVALLTTGYWPTYTPIEVLVPKQLVQYQEIFTKFYVSKHMGRKLTWQPNLGHCVLKAFFDLVSLAYIEFIMIIMNASSTGNQRIASIFFPSIGFAFVQR